MGNQQQSSRLYQRSPSLPSLPLVIMKSAAALLALIGFVSVSQVLGGAITDLTAKLVVGANLEFTLITDTDIAIDGTLTLTADRPIFAKAVTAAAGKVITTTNPAKDNAWTAGTDNTGKIITMTFTTTKLALHANAKVITLDSSLLLTAANGLIPGTVGITATASAGPGASGTIVVPIFPASDTATSFAIGIPTMATSQIKAAAPGDY